MLYTTEWCWGVSSHGSTGHCLKHAGGLVRLGQSGNDELQMGSRGTSSVVFIGSGSGRIGTSKQSPNSDGERSGSGASGTSYYHLTDHPSLMHPALRQTWHLLGGAVACPPVKERMMAKWDKHGLLSRGLHEALTAFPACCVVTPAGPKGRC
jgi:hypothetical protein